jgi:hypothetical protein
MECATVSYSRHALERMFARGISPEQVQHILRDGETVESYPDDKPCASSLLAGRSDGTWLHVVVAFDPDDGRCIAVTAYLPDPRAWDGAFRHRRQS